MATGGCDEQATMPAPRGLLGAVVDWPFRAVGGVLDEGFGLDTAPRLRRWRRAGLVAALVVAVGDALLVSGLVAFDITRMALAIGRAVAEVVPT